MATPRSFRAVYKSIENQEIDAYVYVRGLIDIHGGAFMLGSSKMVNKNQITDCLNRGWIIVVPNRRLCPQIPDSGRQDALVSAGKSDCLVGLGHISAFGTSAGGTLDLCLGFGAPRPVADIYDIYGPCHFAHPFWTRKLPHTAATLPPNLDTDCLNRVFDVDLVPLEGGVSLEGRTNPGGPDFSDSRQVYALTPVANGTVMDRMFPSKKWDKVDPLRNVTASFPPTFIVHGEEDNMVPYKLSKDLYRALLVPGESHTFAARMVVGSQTWNIQREGFDLLGSLIK
ncbi:Non-reducing polyketide synthase ausA [Achaetomium macrosporum]|uniref:Non-reducing polyketide synthase ausA n=1 Tax=Achaetomium macrosporum TaxID=79813 RepID=A0AAN7C813_9PEZI|nr:Non-reducing polyketide synthase ausA [Achaetomium macrosporum]